MQKSRLIAMQPTTPVNGSKLSSLSLCENLTNGNIDSGFKPQGNPRYDIGFSRQVTASGQAWN